MFRRGSALFFTIFAVTIVLAYAVIPHHHHESEVCVISSHCETGNDEHKQTPIEHNHEHDGENNFDHCALDQVFITPFNQLKPEFEYLSNTGHFSQLDLFQATLLDNDLLEHFPVVELVDQHHFLLSTYYKLASTSIGLRAPPIV